MSSKNGLARGGNRSLGAIWAIMSVPWSASQTTHCFNTRKSAHIIMHHSVLLCASQFGFIAALWPAQCCPLTRVFEGSIGSIGEGRLVLVGLNFHENWILCRVFVLGDGNICDSKLGHLPKPEFLKLVQQLVSWASHTSTTQFMPRDQEMRSICGPCRARNHPNSTDVLS